MNFNFSKKLKNWKLNVDFWVMTSQIRTNQRADKSIFNLIGQASNSLTNQIYGYLLWFDRASLIVSLMWDFSGFYPKRNVIIKRTNVKVLLFRVNNRNWFNSKMVRYHKKNKLKLSHCLDLTITTNINWTFPLISKCFSDCLK